ncbi:ankyrin repeat domain-containing protein [Dyella sp.]|uniref:ankyrin repeat domain-containing protein n=1 Tax=Dyella sp. TaxID=1869338 RepID=UPI002FD9C578
MENFFVDPKAQALAVAAEYGDAQAVHRLMKDEGVNPDAVFSKEGMPLLAWPIFTHNPKGLKAMLENGADPNIKQAYRTPDRGMRYHGNAMVWAAKQEDSIYLKLLLDQGGDPDTRNANNETLLFQAFIWHNQWQNVQLLVERGADVNALAGTGAGILQVYAEWAAFDKVYWLLEHGADPSIDYMINQPTPRRSRTIEAIFWSPVKPKGLAWQARCQQWLLQHGYKRPAMPDVYRDMRKDFGLPSEEKDIPLP